MSPKMKNIAQAEVLTLKEQISYQERQMVSKTLAQNPAVSVTQFSFAKPLFSNNIIFYIMEVNNGT